MIWKTGLCDGAQRPVKLYSGEVRLCEKYVFLTLCECPIIMKITGISCAFQMCMEMTESRSLL